MPEQISEAEPYYGDELSVPTLMQLLADYTRRITVTNAFGEDYTYPNGCVWEEAFVFGLPKDLIRAEVNRMAAWCLTHRAEADEAVQEAKHQGDW